MPYRRISLQPDTYVIDDGLNPIAEGLFKAASSLAQAHTQSRQNEIQALQWGQERQDKAQARQDDLERQKLQREQTDREFGLRSQEATERKTHAAKQEAWSKALFAAESGAEIDPNLEAQIPGAVPALKAHGKLAGEERERKRSLEDLQRRKIETDLTREEQTLAGAVPEKEKALIATYKDRVNAAGKWVQVKKYNSLGDVVGTEFVPNPAYDAAALKRLRAELRAKHGAANPTLAAILDADEADEATGAATGVGSAPGAASADASAPIAAPTPKQAAGAASGGWGFPSRYVSTPAEVGGGLAGYKGFLPNAGAGAGRMAGSALRLGRGLAAAGPGILAEAWRTSAEPGLEATGLALNSNDAYLHQFITGAAPLSVSWGEKAMMNPVGIGTAADDAATYRRNAIVSSVGRRIPRGHPQRDAIMARVNELATTDQDQELRAMLANLFLGAGGR